MTDKFFGPRYELMVVERRDWPWFWRKRLVAAWVVDGDGKGARALDKVITDYLPGYKVCLNIK